MYRKLGLQRRRIVLVAILAAAAGATLSHGASLATVFVCVTFFTGTLFLCLGTHPVQRYRVTTAAVAVLLMSVVVSLGGLEQWAPTLVFLAILSCLLLPARLTSLNAIRLSWRVTSSANRRIRIAPNELWKRIYPVPTLVHWDPQLLGILPGAQPDQRIFVYDTDDRGGETRVPVRITDVVAGKRFGLCGPGDEGDAGKAVGETVYEIARWGNRAAVLTLRETVVRRGLWAAVNAWLDDSLGTELDRLAELLEERPAEVPFAPRLVEL